VYYRLLFIPLPAKLRFFIDKNKTTDIKNRNLAGTKCSLNLLKLFAAEIKNVATGTQGALDNIVSLSRYSEAL
jgi:hypothetical protein